MSQQRNPPQAALCFESLVEKQRHWLNRMLSSQTPTHGQPEIATDQNQQEKSAQAALGDATSPLGSEKEWISNWRFERIASTKKPQAFGSDSDSPSSRTNSATLNASHSANNNEGGIFYFERINALNNDCAAADSNDDSEISFDDLMDIEDDEHSRDYVEPYSALSDVDEFLNKSTTTSTPLADDDIHMMSHEDDIVPNYSSPVTSKESLSCSLTYECLQDYTDSPTCVAHPMPAPPLFNTSFSMSSASTRPAFQQMRKMMTDLIDTGNMPRPRQQDMQLPCAEGMDEMYLDTVRKLSASMARSNRTRKSLSIPIQSMKNDSCHHQEYSRVNQILESVESSSRQVDTCLRSVRMMNR
eukprot:jgi/Psemu1/257511/estExt_Genewise1Plus.C_2290002